MNKKSDKNTKEDKSAKKVNELEEKLNEMEKNWIRALADYKNLEKRVTQDKIALIEYANKTLVENLLDVLDNFEMMAAHTDDEGITMSVKEFRNVLESSGLNEIEVEIGDEFDPENMDAIECVRGKENKVVEIIRKGYNFKQNQIRPVSVKVGSGENAEPENKKE